MLVVLVNAALLSSGLHCRLPAFKFAGRPVNAKFISGSLLLLWYNAGKISCSGWEQKLFGLILKPAMRNSGWARSSTEGILLRCPIPACMLPLLSKANGGCRLCHYEIKNFFWRSLVFDGILRHYAHAAEDEGEEEGFFHVCVLVVYIAGFGISNGHRCVTLPKAFGMYGLFFIGLL